MCILCGICWLFQGYTSSLCPLLGASTVSFMFLMTPSVAFCCSSLSAKQVWPVTSAVCVCLAYYSLYLKTKNQKLLISTKGSLSICLTLCEKMHCGSGATNFSQQTADAGVVQQHPEDSAGTQPRLAQPHQHRQHKATVPDAASVTCCRTTAPPQSVIFKDNRSNCFKLRQAVENTQPHAELHVLWNVSASRGIGCFSIRKASFHR